MIVVATPSERQVKEFQNREATLYFSLGAESIIRGAGIVNVRSATLDELHLSDRRDRAVVTRGAEPTSDQIESILTRNAVFEGPLATSVLQALGLSSMVVFVETLQLRDKTGRGLWAAGRSQMEVFGPAREVIRLEQPSEWLPTKLPIQIITGPIDEVFLTAGLPDGRRVPAVFRSGKALVCTFPIFDMGVELLTFAPMQLRWRRRMVMTGYEEMARSIVNLMAAHLASDGAMPIVTVGDWPKGYSSALCVRHDYDREISDASLLELLEFYKNAGIRSSIGFLSYRSPAEQIGRLHADGHEIQMHVWQSDEETFLRDVDALSGIAHERVVGASIHGNDHGFRGDLHYGWFEKGRLEYAELFRTRHFPAPIYRVSSSGLLSRSSLFGTPSHSSLDVDTTPETHRLDAVKVQIDAELACGGAAIPMNHPDINRGALYSLLSGVTRDKAWCVPLQEIVRWTRTTKHDARVAYTENSVAVSFPQALPAELTVTVSWTGGRIVSKSVQAAEDYLSFDYGQPSA